MNARRPGIDPNTRTPRPTATDALIGGLVTVAMLPFMHLFSASRPRRSFRQPVVRTRESVQAILAAFMEGTVSERTWRMFVWAPIVDLQLDNIRRNCRLIERDFPPDTPGDFCSARGIAMIEGFIRELDRAPAA